MATGTVALAFGIWVLLDAAWWIAAILAALALPALIEAALDREAFLELDDARLRWRSGSRSGDLPIGDIAQARFRTTFDLSQRLVLRCHDGRRIAVPPACLPPGRTLEHALEACGVTTHRGILRD